MFDILIKNAPLTPKVSLTLAPPRGQSAWMAGSVGKKSAKRVKRAWGASLGSEQKPAVMALADKCPRCNGLLIEIDHYGDRLIGCIKCNRWSWPGSDKPFMALPDDDLQALNNLSDARHKAEDTEP